MSWKSNQVCFTLNNYTDQDVLDLKGNPKISYLVFGYETGENGTPHLQGYLEVKARNQVTWFKKHIHKTAHYEPRKGSLEQAVTYCKKDGNFHEQGEARRAEQGKRNDLALIKELVMVNHASMTEVIEAATSYQQLRSAQILMTYRPMLKRDKPRIVHWYYGPTGVGKTRAAFDEAMLNDFDIWVSHDSLKWFDGYNGQRHVIIDDFRPRMISFEFFLRLLDRYPVRVPVKGSYVEWEADEIWITCHKSPEETYTWEGNLREDIGQLLRRIDHTRSYDEQSVVNDLFNMNK